jgi:RNA polymerase sigma-70 factor (ECF subfamily)
MLNYLHMEDELLLGLIAAGDQRALGALYDRYARRVYSLAVAILRDSGAAEEVAQEVFFKVWQRAASFDPQRGRPSTWLLSVAHHQAVDTLRRQRRRYHREAPWTLEVEDLPGTKRGEAPEEAAVLNEEGHRVREALGRLPPEQQQVIALAYFQGFTQAEISHRLRQPLGTVKTRMRLGMQKLRHALEPWLRGES